MKVWSGAMRSLALGTRRKKTLAGWKLQEVMDTWGMPRRKSLGEGQQAGCTLLAQLGLGSFSS